MKNYFVMPRTEGLSTMEEAVLLVISRISPGKDGWIRISREGIAKKINAFQVNIKGLDTITKHTNKLQDKGFITKDTEYNNNGLLVSKYKVKKSKKFRLLGNPLYDIDIKLTVFLSRLSDYCWDNTNKVLKSNLSLIKDLKISKANFYANINKAINLGIIKKIDGGYELNSYWFPLKDNAIKAEKPTKEQIDTMKQISTVDSKVGHFAKWFLENDIFEQENWKDIYNKVLSGTLNGVKEYLPEHLDYEF